MDILNSIPILDEEEDNKLQLEDIEGYHSSLTLDNPLTYKIFLSKRLDLAEEEKEIYKEIIKRLEHNEAIKYKKAMACMIDSTESLK